MNPTPACRHLHTDGRPCGSPALRGEPFCFHHHNSRQPMPKRTDHTAGRDLRAPQLPAPEDFPAIQRGIGEILRLLSNGDIADTRASVLLRGLAIASQNLARQHRREEKLAAAGLLPAPVTSYVNDPRHGTLAPEQGAPRLDSETGVSTETPAPLPQPIPVITADPSPSTSFDQAKTIEINEYFQTIDDKRRERSRLWAQQFELDKSLELEALYEDRLREATADLERRVEARLEVRLAHTAIQQNQDLSPHEENCLALAS